MSQEIVVRGTSDLGFGDITGDAILTTQYLIGSPPEQSVRVAVSHHFVDLQSTVRRVVRLSDGASMDAIHLIPDDPEDRNFAVGVWAQDDMILLIDGNGRVWTTYSPKMGWEFKLPRHDESKFATWCYPFSLVAEPNVAFFGCEDGLHVMKERGSSVTSVLPDSEYSAVGDGNHGLAVWAQHPVGEDVGRVSRIRSWVPGGEIQTIKELPGDVCRLAVGREHIAGFRGDVPEGSGMCRSALTKPRFFWISREDGELKEGPILPAEEMSVRSLVTTDRFTAAKTLLSPNKGIPHEERTRVTLIRHSDGKMRQFTMPPAGYSMGLTTVALDDEYLYFTRWNATPGDHTFDRVFRYRLDLFDEIGIPYPPEDD